MWLAAQMLAPPSHLEGSEDRHCGVDWVFWVVEATIAKGTLGGGGSENPDLSDLQANNLKVGSGRRGSRVLAG